MAKFINTPINGIDELSEIQTYEALKQLDDEWSVIHSVAWQGLRRNKESDGEADFVLIGKNAGVVILEVKGGKEILIEQGQWKSKRYNDGIVVDIALCAEGVDIDAAQSVADEDEAV